MHIDSLWVNETLGGHDYGTQLMKMVEDEALRRGCTIAYTDTFSWQAPGFYEKLEGFPKDNALSYYSKKLNL